MKMPIDIKDTIEDALFCAKIRSEQDAELYYWESDAHLRFAKEYQDAIDWIKLNKVELLK